MTAGEVDDRLREMVNAVGYEVTALAQQAAFCAHQVDLERRGPIPSEWDRVAGLAALEAALLHTRNLLEFLTLRPHGRYFRALDLEPSWDLDEAREIIEAEAGMTTHQLNGLLSKHLTHISWDRAEVGTVGPHWQLFNIARAIVGCFDYLTLVMADEGPVREVMRLASRSAQRWVPASGEDYLHS